MKKALLVGINYRGTSSELQGCINDIENIELLLRQTFGYSDIEVQTDDTVTKPTRANMIAGLNRLVNGARAGDKLYFHYSGHGALIRDTNKDEVSKYDSAIVPMDYYTQGCILDDQLKQIVSKLPSGVQLFCVLDACHSGTGFDLRYQYTDNSIRPASQTYGSVYNGTLWTTRQTSQENTRYSKTAANVVMLSGCRDPQTSADTYENGEYCGALTWAFIETLSNNLTPKMKYLLKDVRGILFLNGYDQTPQLSCGNAWNSESILSL